MSGRRRWQTALVAMAAAVLGFASGAFGSAWQTRELRADPWRKIRVAHEGVEGASTRTRLVFENPKLPLQAVEVRRDPEGNPRAARVTLQSGAELSATFRSAGRPASLEASDGTQALLVFKGDRARVAFVSPAGEKIGDEVVTVPPELHSPLRLSQRSSESRRAVARLLEVLADAVVAQAFAQDATAETVTVRRDVAVRLDVRPAGQTTSSPGKVDVETRCPAPFTCLPTTPSATAPGTTIVRIGVSASSERSTLTPPAGPAALKPFEQTAADERESAAQVLPDVAAVVAAVAVTAQACKPLDLTSPLCVGGLAKSRTSGPAVLAIRSHEVDAGSRVIDRRAEVLYYEEQARSALDRETTIELCISREGFARTCTKVAGRPFGSTPMAQASRSLELRRGIGGTLAGSFEMVQSDGPDCKFSPSPRTRGTLKLTFDNEKNTATGSLKCSDRGTRPNMTCSLGTANMSWSNSYGATVTQSFSAAELQSGGKLPLKLTGTMSGTGSYSFSNCRTRSGASANCPAGKSDSYSYRIELVGNLDLSTQKGSGRIVVHGAPLATVGTWRIPPEGEP